MVHLQLRADAGAAPDERRRSPTPAARGYCAHLAAVSRDFAESLAEDPSAGDLRVQVHDPGTGPFAGTDPKIKNVYLVKGGRVSGPRTSRRRPPRAQAGAMFIGATRYGGPRDLVMLHRTWSRMVRADDGGCPATAGTPSTGSSRSRSARSRSSTTATRC